MTKTMDVNSRISSRFSENTKRLGDFGGRNGSCLPNLKHFISNQSLSVSLTKIVGDKHTEESRCLVNFWVLPKMSQCLFYSVYQLILKIWQEPNLTFSPICISLLFEFYLVVSICSIFFKILSFFGNRWSEWKFATSACLGSSSEQWPLRPKLPERPGPGWSQP
jgi:hypothetical protein